MRSSRTSVCQGRTAGTPSTTSCGAAARSISRCSGSPDRKSTRLNSSHVESSYAVFCLKKKTRPRVVGVCGSSEMGAHLLYRGQNHPELLALSHLHVPVPASESQNGAAIGSLLLCCPRV